VAIASEWLAEIGAHTGSAPTVLRFSSCGFTSKPDDMPANTHYNRRIVDPGSFETHLFSPGRTMGPAEMRLGDLSLGNIDGALDGLLAYAFDGQAVTLKRLAGRSATLAGAETILRATCERLDAEAGGNNDNAVLRMRFYDRRRELDRPIQTNRYLGTTTSAAASAEGSADLADRIKPLGFGVQRHVEPVIVNAFDVVLQVSDGPVASIQLYDGGIALTNDGDTPDLASLIASTKRPGRFKTCLALGLVKPGGSRAGQAAYVWTADVVEGASAADRYAGAVARRMLAKMGMGSGDIDTTSFDVLDALAPYEVGIWLDNEASGMSAIRQVLDSVGGFLQVDSLGRFAAGRLSAPGAPVATIRERDIIGNAFGVEINPDTDGGLPAYKMVLRWGRNYRVFGANEIGTCLSSSDPAIAGGLKQEWREVVSQDLVIQQRHPLAPELALETLLANRVDAEAEASRRFPLYSVDRFVTRATVTRERAEQMPLNNTVRLQVDRLGFAAGRNMVVIGQSNEYGAETVTLTLWG
jgi:hypothetical protein